jgi:hypothetical protein
MDKVVNKLIDESVKGVDTYSHNGSTWLIFTESKQWVIELTESKTLWYNYNFFKNIFNYTSMDVVENQSYITQWVEDNIINGVKHTNSFDNPSLVDVGYTIKNGVKENSFTYVGKQIGCDDAIQNGVKYTSVLTHIDLGELEDAIQNGVKEIKTPNKDGDIKSTLEWMYKNNYQDDYNGSKMINNVIENGVKETQPLPDQSGELIGWGNYYHGKEDRTKPFIDYLEETINFGVKK